MLDFQKFTWLEKERYSKFFQDSPVHYAEYSFFGLWAWLHHYPLEIAYTDSNLCWLKSGGPLPGIFGPTGNWNAITDWDKVLADFEKGTLIYDVPEKVKDILCERNDVKLSEDIDQHEYVYSVQDLIALKGKTYAHKRNRVRAFLDGYEWDYEELTPSIFDEVVNWYPYDLA